MKISCPSCSTEHETKDYPGAFEIPCTCGYSILLPSDTAISNIESKPATQFPGSGVEEMNFELDPVAAKEDDPPLSIDPTPDPQPLATEDSTPALTENLPENMAYDPFQVSEEAVPSPTLQEGSEIISEQPAFIEDSSPKENVQSVLDRAQTASMGQFLGIEIDLEVEGLEKNQLIEMLHKCETLIRDRPWLDLELQNRKIRLEEIVETSKIQRIPEFLAVQIYLSAFEMGGRCKFTPRLENSFQSHPS